MDMDVTLSADEVNARSYLPVDTVHFRIRVEDGRAEANPLRFGVAGGVIEGAIAVNGRTEVPSADVDLRLSGLGLRSEEHTSELQSLMRISYAVFCLKKQTQNHTTKINYMQNTH